MRDVLFVGGVALFVNECARALESEPLLRIVRTTTAIAGALLNQYTPGSAGMAEVFLMAAFKDYLPN